MTLHTEQIQMSEEKKLFFTDKDETKELGCIGHLRGDFGRDGKEFWTTWFPHECNEKNDEFFQDIFDTVINLCREKGNPLFNRGDMRAYCREHPECRIEDSRGPTWGFRIPTQDFMLYLKCSPDLVGDYNFYCYAYDKHSLLKKLAADRGLPTFCYNSLSPTKEIIRLDIGTSGYTPCGRIERDSQVDELNQAIGVSRAQAEAMKCGTMFGWDVPGADPKNYDEYGIVVPQRANRRKDGGER